jgi:hypothetical protein
MTSPPIPPTNPLDPIAVGMSIAANLATDILKHYAPQLEGSFAGRALKRVGLIAPTFRDRLHDSLQQALLRYFTKHPQYAVWGVESFFKDPIVAQQLMAAIVDQTPIDHNAIQQAIYQHLSSYASSRALFEQRGLDVDRIFPDFLECYEQVLREQLSVPEIALLFETWKLRGALEEAIHLGQAQTQAQLDQFFARIEARLAPAALQTAYQSGQQELAGELVDSLDAAGLAKPDQAAQTIQTRLQPLPSLFAAGLCKGRPLHVAADQYFVAHGLDRDTLADWRQALAEALARAGGASTPLSPYFAGDTLLGGFRLCGISEKLGATRFSVFLLPASQNRNVYLELGIAIGLRAPFFLIQEHTASIPPLLEGLSRYTSSGSFRTMRRELPDQIEEYDFGVVRVAGDLPVAGSTPTYLLAAGGLFDDEDFADSISEAITGAYPQLQVLALDERTGVADGSGWALDKLVAAIQAARFGVYRVDETCSPATFLALGISIGLNRPFLMIRRAGKAVPLDLQGIGIAEFSSFVKLKEQLVAYQRVFFDRHAR